MKVILNFLDNMKTIEIDFRIEDTGKEYWLYSVSKIAKEICKQYKGVYMKAFLMCYSDFDRFIDYYSDLLNFSLITEEIIKEEK